MNKYTEIGDLIYLISKEIKTRMDEGIKDSNLGQGQILTVMNLMRLKGHEPISQEMLVEEMKINKGNISRNLAKLSDKGFIEIIQNKNDQRKKQIILKEVAYDEFVGISRVLQEIFGHMVKDIEEDDLAITLETLNQMKKNLSNK
ncbi:MarR family winged helix-turn-helix transcriptional regulator [Clostridium frigidicarnis]|uniref:DNA-binding transcriptional regulator, MarR family n=1 Tax=Clostridium frigidicarnis TaxID=84698 RepID=A0A1I0YBJ0_9CLOT|nr:MarR family transcriptional regulator [Clostridium frigidicarnis]SFB10729.1 DNA-binding transcriptional regulator, MarR family [Clostridium frigidicarnis]